MGALRQLGALLWKNILIRKRHPTFLVLEILWPVVLFVALALMRLGLPPDHRETCQFPERALPSAGLVPFLQSSICTLNNNCSTREWIQERAEAQQRFQSMIREIDPLLHKQTTIDAFRALPTVSVVLNTIKDVSKGTTIDEMDEKLVIRNMFKDPSEVVNILSDKYKVMERRLAESLLDASLNAVALVSGIGSMDFKGIVCDPNKLEDYLILSDKSNRYVVNKYSVSNSLCRIEDDKISDITNELLRQLDVANILRLIRDVANATGAVDYAVLIEDMAELMEMYINESGLLSMVDDLMVLSDLPGIIGEFGKMLPMLNDLADIDFERLGSLFDFISPLLETLKVSPEVIDLMGNIVKGASEGLSSSLSGEMNLEQILEELPKLVNMTELLTGLGLPQSLSAVPTGDVNNVFNMLQGNTSLEDMSLNDTLDYVENMMKSLMGNETADMIMAVASNMMEMMDDIRVHYDNMETGLKYAVTNTDAVTVALNTLEEAGPEVTYTFMSEMVTMENIYTLMAGETSTKALCQDAVNVAYEVVQGYDYNAVVDTVCSDDAVQSIDQVFVANSLSQLTGTLEKEMADMDSILKGTIPVDQEISTMKVMYYDMMDMVVELENMLNEDANEWMAVLEKTNMDYMGDYNWVWNNIGGQYKVQTMTMLPVLIIGKSAVNGPMWESVFSPTFEMVDSVLHNAMNRVEWFEAMNEENRIITKVVKYLPYYPDIFESAVGQNLSELARVFSSNDTTELTRVLCEETHWESIDIPDEVSREDIKMFICQTNITKFVEDVWTIADPVSFISDVELEVEANLEKGIQWTRMAGDLQYLYETLDGKNSVRDLLMTVFQSDLSMMMSYYTVIEKSLTQMTMNQMTSDMENESDIATSLESLDEALKSWDLWKRVRHYIRTWNLLAKVMNEYGELLQDPDWDITEYFTKTSSTLGEYLQNSTATMPDVIDALQTAANQPQQMVERLMSIDFMGFCDDPESLSSLLGVQSTPSFTEFQDGLCKLNWTQIMEEMKDSGTHLSDLFTQWEMILTYDTASLPPISLNWTDVISSTRIFIENVNEGMFNNFMPGLSNFGLTGTNSSVSNLTSALQNSLEFDPNEIGKSIDEVMKLLFDMSAENDTFIEMWHYNVAMQTFINYHFFSFVNYHLDIINSTKNFDLRAHLNSPEANKLLDLMEQSPEVNAVLLHNLRHAATGSNTEQWLSIDFNSFCNDSSKFESVIEMPANSNITKAEVVDAICSTVDGKLFSEVLSGMEGLEVFVEAMENVTSGKMTASEMLISYSVMAAQSERFSELLEALILGGIKNEGFPSTLGDQIAKLMEQFAEFSTDLERDYTSADPLQSLQSAQNQTFQSLMELQDIPGFSEIMRVSEMYMKVLTAMLSKSEAMLVDPETGFQDYPEMYKMWKMMDWLPQLYATYTYTSLIDNSKIAIFTEALVMGIDTLCEKTPADLMTNPPILNIKFEDFFNLFCSVNFTLLEEESMAFIEQQQIADTYAGLANGTEKVDIEEWMVEYNLFIKKLEQFMNSSGQFNVPGFDNMTAWDIVMTFLGDTTNDLAYILTKATNNTGDLFNTLVSMSPDYQNQLKAMEVTYYVMEKMLDHLENMTDEPHKLEDFFYGYGQMQHLMVILQEPGVMETLMASVNTPKFQELFLKTNATAVLIDICDSDITKYMTVPPTVSVNMTDVKDRFCDTKFDILMEEFVDAFFIQDIIDMMSTNTTIDWTSISQQNSMLTERLQQWIENPPNVTLPSDWQNSEYWFELLNLLNGDQAVTDGNASLAALFEGMENFLGSQYADLINSMTPVALQIMEMISLDSDSKRAFATIDLFMEYMVDRLMGVSDNFTVDTLSKNSSDIIRLLEALSDLKDVTASDYEALNETINQEKLYNLLLDPDMLMEMCEKDNVAAYLSANGTASKASVALEEVICIDTATWEQVLQDQINLDKFEKKLGDIWNSSNTNIHLNWTSLTHNTEKFVEMMLNWIQDTPEASGSLMQWNDWDGILSFLTSTYNDPKTLMNILTNINPVFGNEMSNLTNAFTNLLMPFIEQLQSGDIDEILNDPERIGSLIESMASVEDWLKVLSQFFDTYYAPDVMPTRESILDELVCNENNELSGYLDKYLVGVITHDSWSIMYLCKLNQTEWDTTLQTNHGFTEEDLQHVHNMFNHVMEDKMGEHDVQTTIQDITNLFEKLKLDGLLNSSTTDDWLQNSQATGLEELMAVLEMIGEESLLTDFKKSLLVIVEVQEYINTMLEKLTGKESIPITDILPSSSAVASFIEGLTNSETVSTFTLAYIDPAKFITLMFSKDWNSTVCNKTLFLETFEFPADVNVTSLQQHLCTDYASQQPYLDDIFKAVDMNKLIQSIEDIFMNDTVTANQDTWSYMSSLVESIITRMIDLENSNVTGFEEWIEPVLKTLESMGAENQDVGYEETCDRVIQYAMSTGMYSEWVKPYLDTFHSFIMISYSVMNVQIGIDEAVCQTENKNITNILKHLEELGVPNELTKIEEIMSQKAEKEFSCSSYSSYYQFFETFATSLAKAFDGSSNIVECIGDTIEQSGELLNDISRLFSAGSEAFELLQNEDIQKLLNSLMGSNDSTTTIDTILQLYNQQESAVKQLQGGLEQNLTDITGFLQETLSTGIDSVFSSLNMTFLMNVENMTAEEVIESLCESGNLEKLDPNLQSTLCGEDEELAKEVANSLVEYSKTLQELESMAEYDSTAFWEKVSNDLSALIGNIEGLSSLTSLVDRLGKVDISTLSEDMELLKSIQELLVDNGPDAILENLNTLLDDFKVLDDSNMTNAVLDDVRLLSEGIFAFTALRDMFLADVKVKDLVKDTAKLREYMINEMLLPENVTDAIVDGSLGIRILLSAAEEDITGWICDSEKLAELIDVKEGSDLDLELVSKQFCSLDSDTVSALVDDIFQQLDIGQLMEDMVVNGISGILRNANVTLDDTKDAVKKLVDANEDLQEVTKTFNNFAKTIPDAFSTLAEAQTGDEEFGSLAAILCGNAIPMINDEFNTGAALEGQSDLNEEQKKELNALPGNACKDMYLRILEDRNGPIIWAYLKPLLRGKLLFTPNTPEVRKIVAKINTTFASLEEFIDLAVDWAEGSVSLGDLTGTKAKELQDLLDNNVIKSMMTEVAGVDMKDLDDILYTLEDTDMDMMEGISKVAIMIRDYVSCLLLDRFEGYDTEKELEKAANSLVADNNLLAGIVFDMSDGFIRNKRQVDTNAQIPKHIHYKIRMDVDNAPTTDSIKDKMWRPQPYDDFFTELRYFRGFAQLQDMIDEAIISLHVGENVTLPSVTTRQFPFPCHTQDLFVNTIAGYLLNVLMTLSWLAAISVAVYNFVYDRERGQEETLIAMGMTSGLNWIAWFFTTMFIMAIVALIDVLILRYGNIFVHSNIAIMFLYFLDFIFSTIMLCYFVSAFFTRTSLAILACIIVYVISYLPYVVLFALEVQMKFWHKTLACLASTSAFSYAAQFIARFEEQQIGLQWDNIRDDPMKDDEFSFSWCCIMILIDGVIYFILGWYVRNVKPGKFGVAEPWYFIFVPSMWCGRSSGKESRYAPQNGGIFAEEVKSDTPVVLSARGLSKTYSDGTNAVKDLNLDIHLGNVTTLLGHNGAAKTTTMNMLIGILQPSKGGIRILNRPLKEMKGCLGLCSQNNALYDYMTVKEHMEFYSSMKGGSVHGLSAKDEVRQLLKDVDLYYCRNMLVKNLSGGMQRRLCVALAFVGGSKAVILDEPTSGVDPSGRRAVWNLIIRRKSDKTNGGTAVLLSTHHLDEADIISDQIAVMHEGSLLCQGSPMFLKKHLASGHRLTVVKETTDTDPVPVMTLLKRWLPGVKLQTTAGAEMMFVLPTANEADFYALFQELESQKQALGIVSYGISDPKLEEVFLKVCSAADIGRKISPETLRNIEEEGANGDSTEWKHDFEKSASTGSSARLSKSSSGSGGGITALLIKRFHHYRRDWRILISTLILPLLLFLLASGLYKVKPDATASPNLYISPAMYGQNNYVFMKENSMFALGDDIFDTFMTNPGIGTSCMEGIDLGEPYECVTPDSTFTVPSNNASTDGRCFCDDNTYKCEGSPYGAPPEQRITPTTDILQNLQGRDINRYLLDSFHEFILKRFGGWSFDDESDDANTKLKANIWYNNHGYHAMPAFFNAYSNGLLRALVNDSKEAHKYGISTYSHPFMFGRRQLSKFSIIQHAADIGIAVMILLAFTFIPVGVLLYSVYENTNKEKHMQFISGVTPLTYWIASLIWDLLVLGVAVGCAVIILLIFKPGSFWDRENLEATVCLLLLYGWATITLGYLLAKRFKNSGIAFFTVFCTLMFLGIFCVIVLFAFNYFVMEEENDKFKKTNEVLRYVFLVFPPYALCGGLLDLIDNQIRTVIYERFDTDVYKNPFTFDLIGWHLFAMGVEGLLFLILTIWIDVKCCCTRKYECSVKENTDEDTDVSVERKRIDTGNNRDDVVIVRNLHKIYNGGGNEVHAVNGLSFGVPAGQCFGLLGVNGAGKTSTFNVLTGVTDASYGHCYILGNRIEPGSSTVGRNMGYCSQNDALDPYLSITNTLYFHAKLKGIDGSNITQAVEKVMAMLDLNKIKNKLVKSCSGGMKRKLSLAVALLGDPAVVLLDEPTSGMDPKAKRLVWNCLLEAKKNGQAIILTSHSLEECDILCDRIGIMVNGEFKCLGTSQHLKQKYGDGYTVTLYVTGLSDSMARIHDLIHKFFPRAGVTDQHVNVVQLEIPRDAISIADLFGILEREKAGYNILYYTVSQTTLDTIFLNFAREQTDGSAVEMSDTNSTSSERDSYNSNSLQNSAFANPYYAHTNPSLNGEKYKGRSSAAYDNPYILPSKNTFSDEESGYSVRM